MGITEVAQLLGNIGEFIGAIAVVVSLIYVAQQIRQNTRQLEQNTQAVTATAVDASVGRFNETRRTLYSNAEMMHIYQMGAADPESLEFEILERYRMFMHSLLYAAWNVYAQTDLTGMPPTTWSSLRVSFERIMDNPGGRWFWQGYRLEFEESFRVEIDGLLREVEVRNEHCRTL